MKGWVTPAFCASAVMVSPAAVRADRRAAPIAAGSIPFRATLASCPSLERGDVCPADPAVDQEGRCRDERGVVAGQEGHRGGNFLRFGEASHRHVYESAGRAFLVRG